VRPFAVAILCLVLAACGEATPSESSGAVELARAPADLGCDAVPPPYSQAVFHMDVTADEPVWADADAGVHLRTFWSAGFRGPSPSDPVVRDPAGKRVVADGDLLVIPEGDWPRIEGYFVCPSTDALYVLLTDPE
jgi:hypothetical protein